jgi:cellulose synthase/poly-beta-1,6-N-acetylglucosamine synthase-like glycosyltransferase
VPLIEIVGLILIFLAGSVLLIDMLLLFFLKGDSSRDVAASLFDETNRPSVSVLVAARNEEATLSRCIESLLNQQYPADKIQVLIGNDASNDKTEVIARSFETESSRLKVFNIDYDLGSARGKANVLSQLAREATGEVYLITDADMSLPPTWCKAMVTAFEKDTGMVTGYTAINENSLFASFQAIDWAYAIGMMKVVSDLGMPVTGMGNNMAVLAKAYHQTGGYENMPFSVTEDFQLTRAILSRGYGFKQLISPAVTGITLPAASIKGLLHQRKRWMSGALQLPVAIVAVLGLQAIYYPLAVVLIVFYPWSILLVAAKGVVQSWFVYRTVRLSALPVKIGALVLFEFYSAIISLSTLLFSILPSGIKWKDRHY